MKTTMRLSSLFGTLALLLALAVVPDTAKAAVTFSVPTAPQNVTAVAADGGFTITWSDPSSNGNAAISKFVIDGGQGTCVTTVDGSQHSAFVPAISGSAAAFKVYAVNSQGFGAASTASSSVTPNAVKSGFFTLGKDGRTTNLGSSTGNFSRLKIQSSSYLGSVSTPSGNGAWLLTASQGLVTVGDATITTATLSDPAAALISSYNRLGYYVVGKYGQVLSSANVPNLNNSSSSAFNSASKYIVGAVATSSSKGIWLVGASGKITGLGDAKSDNLAKARYVRVIPRATGDGFWAITSTGSVVSYGDAPTVTGSATGVKDVSLAANGKGFYVLNSAGTITAFGDVPALGTSSVAKAVALINTAKIQLVKDFQIDAFSDFHGALDYTKTTAGGFDTYTSGAATMAANFAADRAQNPATFTFSSGDNWGAAPPLSTVFDEMPSVKALNYMGVT